MASANGTLPSIAKAAFNRRALSALVDRAICHIHITSYDACQAQGTSFANPSLPSQIRNYLLCKGSGQPNSANLSEHGHRVPGVLIVPPDAGHNPVHLVCSTGHEVAMFGVGIQMSSSVPPDNEHCLIVNTVLFANLSQVIVFF
jgi:hypothetical protein